MTAALCCLFLISGVAGLVFETLWFHQATLMLGSSVWASSLVLAGFMGGLGAGNGIAAKFGDRVDDAVRTYALLEFTIAVAGVGLVYLLPALGWLMAGPLEALDDHLWLLNAVRFTTALVVLLAPSTAMGMTLPLLAKALTSLDSNFGRVLGRLYGWNTLGAVGGAILAEWVLIGAIGIRGSAFAAGSLNVAAGIGALILAPRLARGSEPAAAEPASGSFRGGGPWLAAAALSGFALLALEVVWFRVLLLYLYGVAEIFAVMLATVLAGIALGGLFASGWLKRMPDAHRYCVPVSLLAGSLCVISYLVLPLIGGNLAPGVQSWNVALTISGALMFPTSFVSGVLFTLLGSGLRDDFPNATSTAGALTLANTVGASLGALAGGFLFLPGLGMENSLLALTSLYAVAAITVWARSRAPGRWLVVSVVVFVASCVFFPFGSMENVHQRRVIAQYGNVPAEQITVRESVSETILYIEVKELGHTLHHRMVTNGFSMSGTAHNARRYMKLYTYWPAAVHPNLESALLISYGVGSTAKSLVDTASLKRIDVVDISKDILEMSDIVYGTGPDHPLRDPRVEVHIEDGRQFLQSTSRRFDLITAEPPPPTLAGVENLYSREFFQLTYDRLNEGGVVTYWLPIHTLTDRSTLSIIRAFCDAFADCSLWNGAGKDLMLVGTRNLTTSVSREHFVRQWNDPVVAPELRALAFEVPEQLGALFIGDSTYLAELTSGAEPVADDYPKRITAETSSEEVEAALWAEFRDVDASRARFETSPLIQSLWPASLVADSLPLFDVQRVIDGVTNADRSVSWSSRFEDTRQILEGSEVGTPILWLFGSSADHIKIVESVTDAERQHPEMQLHLAIHRLATRDYDAAIEHLLRAEQHARTYERSAAIHIFTLCIKGEIEAARELAMPTYLKMRNNKGIADYWDWLKTTYAIDPVGDLQALKASQLSETQVPASETTTQ